MPVSHMLHNRNPTIDDVCVLTESAKSLSCLVVPDIVGAIAGLAMLSKSSENMFLHVPNHAKSRENATQMSRDKWNAKKSKK